jgi:hypothetical protein
MEERVAARFKIQAGSPARPEIGWCVLGTVVGAGIGVFGLMFLFFSEWLAHQPHRQGEIYVIYTLGAAVGGALSGLTIEAASEFAASYRGETGDNEDHTNEC